MSKRASQGEQIRQNSQHVIVLKTALGVNRQALSRVFLDDRQHPEGCPIMRSVCDEVVGPHVVLVLRSKTDARAVIKPEPASFRLCRGYFEPFTTPDPCHTLSIYRTAFTAQQGGDPTTAISPVLLR